MYVEVRRELALLALEAGVRLGVDVVEDPQGLGVGQRDAGRAETLGRVILCRLDGRTHLVRQQPEAVEVQLEAQDRVFRGPLLALGEVFVARRVVGGGVRPHAIGDGLDEGRSPAAARTLERDARRGHDGENVVAVNPEARDAEPRGAVGDRPDGLHADGLGDRPLVVLAEEDHGSLEAGGENHGLVDVALAGGTVAEVGDGDRVDAVALAAHRVAGGVQCLGADDDGGRRHVRRVNGSQPELAVPRQTLVMSSSGTPRT